VRELLRPGRARSGAMFVLAGHGDFRVVVATRRLAGGLAFACFSRAIGREGVAAPGTGALRLFIPPASRRPLLKFAWLPGLRRRLGKQRRRHIGR